MFPISPVMEKSLFQLLAEQVLARSRIAGREIPYFIMTSEATHLLTVTFFQENDYFGLKPESVHFFQQGTMPAVDAETGKILLSGIGRIATSPDGHGGVLAALQRAGHFDLMRQMGIEYLYYHQVDNPHAIVLGPEFIGYHVLNQAEVSTKVVRKLSPEEKMGVMVEIDEVPQIIEYSDLPLEVASRRTDDGELELWAGSTAMHVFSVPFLEKFLSQGSGLPFHIAFKSVRFWDGERPIEPEKPNAFKFERFIFDVIPHSQKSLVVETSREREFNPVKNAVGPNSPEHVRHTLSDQYRRWVHPVTGPLPEDQMIEVSPLFAVDEQTWETKQASHPQPQRLKSGLYWG
jgi:UDP-N-acetylglucosamine/UDP-N-acetylgalactosamine diphosphorylase